MSKIRDTIFVFLVCFWVLLTILSHVFIGYIEEPLLKGNVGDLQVKDLNQDDQISFMERAFSILDKIPVVNVFTPLLKITTFQYSNQVPYIVSLLLMIISILSGFTLYGLLRWST